MELRGIDSGSEHPLILAIDEAVDAQRELEQQLRTQFEVNNTDFRALMLVLRLQRRGQPAPINALIRSLGLTSGAASQVVGRLVTAGLLERAADPSDARAGRLLLTERARQLLSTATEGVRRDLDSLLDTIAPAQERQIIELVDRVGTIFRNHRDALGTERRG